MRFRQDFPQFSEPRECSSRKVVLNISCSPCAQPLGGFAFLARYLRLKRVFSRKERKVAKNHKGFLMIIAPPLRHFFHQTAADKRKPSGPWTRISYRLTDPREGALLISLISLGVRAIGLSKPRLPKMMPVFWGRSCQNGPPNRNQKPDYMKIPNTASTIAP